MFCTACGNEVAEGARFCVRCGKSFETAAGDVAAPISAVAKPGGGFASLVERFGPIVGAIYLYLVSFSTVAGSAVGFLTTQYALERYACWVSILAGVSVAVCATTLIRMRDRAGTVIFAVNVLLSCWLYDRAHEALVLDAGPGGGGVPVPGWFGIFVSYALVSLVALPRVVRSAQTTSAISAVLKNVWLMIASASIILLLIVGMSSQGAAANAGLFATPPQ